MPEKGGKGEAANKSIELGFRMIDSAGIELFKNLESRRGKRMKRLQRFLAGCLSALLVISVAAPAGAVQKTNSYAAASSRFADTAGHMAEKAIERWASAGVVSGNGNSFAPDNVITRAEMCRILTSLFGLRTVGGSMFTDVAADAWYAPYVNACAKAGVVSGYGNGVFGPNDIITWEQALSMLSRGLDIRKGSGDTVPLGCITSDWAANAVAAMAKYGVPTNLDLTQGISRGYVMYILDDAVDVYINKSGTHKLTVNGGNGVILVAANDVTLTGKTDSKVVVAQGVSPTADKKTDVFVECSEIGDITIIGDDIIVEISKDTDFGHKDISDASSNSKFIIEEEAKKTSSSSGGNRRPNKPQPDPDPDPTPVTVSPDKAAIIAQMTDITNGFSVQEQASEVQEAHPYHFETKSHPFSSMYCSVGNVSELAEQYGYGEKEFFMSGLANVYGLHENGVNVPIVKTADVDYTTRLLIHYPKDESKFSGRVYVDILNASAGYDLEDIWRRSYENMMRSGDIYIGITSKDSSAQALKNFNPERYAALDWCVDNSKKDIDWVLNPGNSENGLFWDMLSQLGTLIKENPQALFGADLGTKVQSEGKSYLVGQSQSAFYMNTYLNAFYPYLNNILDGKDIWDGYMAAVGMSSQTALSTGVSMAAVTEFLKTDEPYIVIQSGAEANYRLSLLAQGRTLYDFPANDTDKPMLRVYEVAGAPHADPTAAILPNNYEIAKANTKNTNGAYTGASRDLKNYTGDHVEGDLHLDEFITAALVNLDNWARNGQAAPASVALEPGKDDLDNQMGGLRSPKLEAPIATYYPVINNKGPYATEGSMIYLTSAQLSARYPNGFNQYKSEFKAQADKLLSAGYIIQEDYNKLIAYSESASIFGNRTDDMVKTLTSVPEVEDVTPIDNMETMFNSTAMSISAKYADEWDAVALEWAKSLIVEGDKIRMQGDDTITYQEKEFFVRGDANLYTIAPDNELLLQESGLEYINRIIVRTPADPNAFTGKVYVDILNATDKFDNEALWRRAGAMIMTNGDAYIGITSKPVTVETLKRFNDRYDEISWASPNTYIHSNFKASSLPGHLDGTYLEGELPGTDIGLIWDIVSQTGMLAKNEQTVLFGSSGKTINTYLFGQSQSGFYVNTFTRFQKLLEEKDAELPYNGMMTMVGTLQGAMKLNQSDKTGPKNAQKTFPQYNNATMYYIVPNDLKTPFMTVTSENDMNDVFHASASDTGNYRCYELAGVPHSDNNSPTFPTNDILNNDKVLLKDVNMNYIAFDSKTKTYSIKDGGSDINANMFIRGLLTALDEWATEGKTPPANAYITKAGVAGTANAEGGLRSPQLDVPLNIYAKNGTMTTLSDAELIARYPYEGAYKTAFVGKLNELKNAGYILDIDVAYMTAYADRIEEQLAKLRSDAPIKESILRIPAVTEVPYGIGIDYHDEVIDISHAFDSMYCSNGKETIYDDDPEPVRLEDYGYSEKEYFLTGKAQTYNYDKTTKALSVTQSGIDYTTRVLVRVPEDSSEFNGTVFIDLLNITAGYDNEDLWRRSYKYLMEGSAYVGLTYNATGIQSLKKFNSDRYAPLMWYTGDNKNAIAFDVISQLGSLLRSEEGVKMLGGNTPEQVILTAQSSSGYYLNGYLMGFYPYINNVLDGKDLFDGYLNTVGGCLGIAIDNPDNYANAFMGEFAETDEPFVVIMSEGEARVNANIAQMAAFAYPRKKDTDTFRLYEVAGAPHSDPMSPVLPNYAELTKANTKGTVVTNKTYNDGHYETELNLDQIIVGTMDNLIHWITDSNFDMPSNQKNRIAITFNGQQTTQEFDDYGNAVGGLRMPQIEAPLAKYYPYANGAFFATDGSMVYLSWEQLVNRYGKEEVTLETAEVDTLFEQYLDDFAEAADAICKDGFIRKIEKEALIKWSEAQKVVFEAAKEKYDEEHPVTTDLLEEEIPPVTPEENPDVVLPDVIDPDDGAADDTNPDADGADNSVPKDDASEEDKTGDSSLKDGTDKAEEPEDGAGKNDISVNDSIVESSDDGSETDSESDETPAAETV